MITAPKIIVKGEFMLFYIPQVAETNTPRSTDDAGQHMLYYTYLKGMRINRSKLRLPTLFSTFG